VNIKNSVNDYEQRKQQAVLQAAIDGNVGGGGCLLISIIDIDVIVTVYL
jgi:hypothetical protein